MRKPKQIREAVLKLSNEGNNSIQIAARLGLKLQSVITYLRQASGHHLENITDTEFEPTEMPKPTMTFRGSRERVEVYRKRLENDQILWHPDDNKNGLVREHEPIRDYVTLAKYRT